MGFLETINGIIAKLEGIPEETARIVEYNADELLQLRKDEILLGRDSDGNPFSPDYLHDPYFKSPQAALAYANYKYRFEALHNSRIEHSLMYPNKDSDTPNLRFTLKQWRPGENFQDSMFIHTDKDGFIIGSTYEDAASINAKYDGKVYDLGPGAKQWFYENILLVGLKYYLHN